MSSSAPERPFSDTYLLVYSDEHVAYELDMFLWLANVKGSGVLLTAPTPAETTRLNNVLIEAFVVHLRNVIDFVYLESPKPTEGRDRTESGDLRKAGLRLNPHNLHGDAAKRRAAAWAALSASV